MSEELENSQERVLEVATVSPIERRGGIPIQDNDLRALARALEIYKSGVGEASNATLDNYNQCFAPLSIVAPANASLGGGEEEPYSQDGFINSIVNKVATAQLNGDRRWSRNFEYDGEGRFKKTRVSINFDRGNNTMILCLFAAYAEDQVEEELANTLGVERAIKSKGIRLELPEMPDQDLSVPLEQRQTFRLDCTPIARVINAVVERFGDKNVQFEPEDLVRAFMKKSEYNVDEGSFTVSLGTSMALSLSINGGDRFVYPSHEDEDLVVDTRKAEGSELILPFPTGEYIDKPATDYGNPPQQIKHYTLEIIVERESESKYPPQLPLHTKEQIEKARAVVAFIEEQFRK